MASETGIITDLAPDRSWSVITADSSKDQYRTGPVKENIDLYDGVSFDLKDKEVSNVKQITKVTVEGSLNDQMVKSMESLVTAMNIGGDKGIKIGIKTKM